MAIASARLVEITQLTNAAATYYTNGAAQKSYAQQILLFNNNTTPEVVQIWVVPNSGGAPGATANANRQFYVTIDPLDTIILDCGKPGLMLVDQFDTIWASSTTTAMVNISINGFTE